MNNCALTDTLLGQASVIINKAYTVTDAFLSN